MKKILINALIAGGVLFSVSSCSDRFVDTVFNQSVEQSDFTSVEEYEAGVYGMYGTMRNVGYYGRDFNMYAELRSDYMFSTARSGRYTTVARLNANNNHMLSTDTYASGTYNAIYTVIAKANIVINSPEAGITWKDSSDATVISNKIKHLKAQAYAVRAQALFDLLRLYGQKYVTGGTLGVVVPLTYDPTANQSRASITDTQTQIQSDFQNAVSLSTQNSQYDDFSNKTSLNSISIKALATRFYLFIEDYPTVRSYVADVVASSRYTVAARDLLVTSFTMNNAAPNSVFELAVGVAGSLGADSYFNIMHVDGSYKNIKARSAVASLYPSGDVRRGLIGVITSGTNAGYYINKYSNGNGEDNIKMIRYEEILLNGVEAELNGGSSTTALSYYTSILSNRLASGSTMPTSVDMNALRVERARELIGEGFRMWDRLRWGLHVPYATSTGAANTAYDLPYGSPYLAFPIPRAEFNVPGNTMVQNEGYDQ